MMKKLIIFLCLIMMIFNLFLPLKNLNYSLAKTDEFDDKPKISSRSALLIDYHSGEEIFSKNANERLPIASMTKLASLSLVFDAISKGAVKENDMVVVSENSASVGGSSAFLDAGSSYKLTDLVKSVIIASANDSCVALAEHVAGSEGVFVSRMNKFAKSLGLNDTNFVNSTGLPAADHYSTASDLAKIYKSMCNNPLYKKYSKIWMDDFIHPSGRKTGLVNTNRLVRTFDGIDGGKTGYTDTAKFCLTTSATRGMTRLIAVVIGANDSKTRFSEATNLLNYGFANFESKLAVNSQIPVSSLQILKGKQTVDVYPARDCVRFTSKESESKFTTEVKLNENIKAPLKSGEKVGKIFVFDKNNMVVDEIELEVRQDVEGVKFKDIFKEVIYKW